jgi:hypothetical protein
MTAKINPETEQRCADNVYLWMANTRWDYDKAVSTYAEMERKYAPNGYSEFGSRPERLKVAEETARYLYERYYCGRRTGDGVFYTLPRITSAVIWIMDI